MTARLTNAIGTRLGLTHSWKVKSIINTKKQQLNLFKRELAFIQVTNSLLNKKDFKKQSVLGQAPIRYYNQNNQLVLDILLYDTAFERIRSNIKGYRRYTALHFKPERKYYTRATVLRYIRGTNLNKSLPPLSNVFEIKKVIKNKTVKYKPTHNLISNDIKNIDIILNNRYLKAVQSVFQKITTKRLQFKIKKVRKALVYNFGRQFFVDYNTAKIAFRIYKRYAVPLDKFKVNLISIPKVYLTYPLLLAFIIKRLYLNYTLLETIWNFKRYFKLRTRGYILRGCGKLTKKQRAWYVKRQYKKTKINNLSEHVTYKYDYANLRYGTVGIKLWINY